MFWTQTSNVILRSSEVVWTSKGSDGTGYESSSDGFCPWGRSVVLSQPVGNKESRPRGCTRQVHRQVCRQSLGRRGVLFRVQVPLPWVYPVHTLDGTKFSKTNLRGTGGPLSQRTFLVYQHYRS